MSDSGEQPEPVYTPLPEGLVDMAPGPELGSVLGSLDRSLYNGYQLVQGMSARNRYLSWVQSQLLLDARELSHAQTKGPAAAPIRVAAADPHAPDEVACALAWSTHAG